MNEELLGKLRKIAKEHKLDLLVLFGSVARGESKKNSDIDLAFLKKTITTDQEIELYDALDSLFKDKKFDLINLQPPISELLKHEIFKEGICIHESAKWLFQKMKEDAYFDYIDSKVLLEPSKEKFLKNKIINE